MKNSNNNIATIPTASAVTTQTAMPTAQQAHPMTAAQRTQLSRYNEIASEFFGLMGSSTVFNELIELYKYMEESGLIEGIDDKATSEIKMNYLYTIQKLGAFVADLERNHAFFKNK